MTELDTLLEQALALHAAGNLQQAALQYGEILARDPDHGDANNLLGVLFHQTGNSEEGIRRISRAVQRYPDRCAYLINLGRVYEELGRGADAEQLYRQALSRAPHNGDLLFNLGNLCNKTGRTREAIHCFERVIELHPSHTSARFNLANGYLLQQRLEEAEKAYCELLALEPDFLDAWINLGELYEKSNKLSKAKECVAQVLRIGKDDAAAQVQAAKLLRRAGEMEEALGLLATISPSSDDPETALRLHFELGKIHDRRREAEQAYKHFMLANELRRRSPQWRTVDKDRFLRRVRICKEKSPIMRQVPESARQGIDGEATPHFLVGFPRSGTTLIGQIVNSHPGLQVLVEKPLLDMLVHALERGPAGLHGTLASLSMEDLREMRAYYFQQARELLPLRNGATLVDQFPLNMIYLDLIEAIFPGAKIILAMRHPYDVCLSCFMQNFQANDAMANFSSLQDAAFLYHEVMTVWEQQVKALQADVHVIKYERLVEDFRGEVGKLLAFLGVDWSDAVLRYHRQARNQVIGTASHDQVIEPIYQRARYRWKSYREHLAPLASLLDPYVERFGYAE